MGARRVGMQLLQGCYAVQLLGLNPQRLTCKPVISYPGTTWRWEDVIDYPSTLKRVLQGECLDSRVYLP